VAVLGALPAAGLGQAPKPGEVQRAQVITLSMQVGSTEKESKQIVYTPPPGWYVKSHRVHCALRTGNSSYTVNTVPRDWGWCSEARITESYRTLIDLAGAVHQAGLRAKFAAERDQLLAEVRKVSSSHHALVVEATARGAGFLCGPGALRLTVTAELVYVGTEGDLRQRVERHRAGLR
jgi:hypothetical protein